MKKYLFTLISLVAITLPSCKTYKKMVYFQTGEVDSSEVKFQYTPTFKPDDFLTITVLGSDPETSLPFNLPTTSGGAGNSSGYSNGNPALLGYLVDANGNINMPVIGFIHIGGMNRMDATQLISQKLSAYISNPVVNIQIQNFKITVLGEVKNPGTFKIPNERITILEAIGLAGDLKNTGIRNNVLVVREINGSKKEFRIDLTQKNVFSSPVYYLEQNDVVYVEPNYTARYESTMARVAAPIIISVTSLIVTTITLITR